jgi:hypothetical protein
MTADEMIDQIRTRDDFVTFVHQLKNEYEHEADYLENYDLTRFLDVLGFWTAHRMDDVFQRQGREVPAQPSWQLFAELLYMTAIYE